MTETGRYFDGDVVMTAVTPLCAPHGRLERE